MAIVLLVRHAMTDLTGKRLYGRSEVHLSDAGRDQAEELARRLKPLPIAAVYSSPLDRCVETAQPIATACGVELRRLDGVTEIDFGTWTGRSFAGLGRTRLWRRAHGRHPSAVRFPEGESLAEAQHRVVEAIESLAAHHPKEMVCVVSHGDPVAMAVAHYAGVHLDLFQRIEVAPGSVSVIAVSEGEPKLMRLNDTGTLENLIPPPRTGRR